MKHLLITKTGGPFFTRAEAARASSSGEQGESEAIINHLLKRKDFQLVYYGIWRGDLPEGLIHIDPDVSGLDELCTEKKQEQRWTNDIQALRDISNFNPFAYINIAGYAPTMCTVGNPKGIQCQASGIRYVAPVLNACRVFGMPRIVINNDPRTYPREQEMTLCWPECVPAALLDQVEQDVETVIGGRKYLRRSVWARAESWCTHPTILEDKSVDVTCIAHAHIKDGCKQRNRNESWKTLLAPAEDIEKLFLDGFRIYGKGWERYDWYDQELMMGVITPAMVMEKLAAATCCPCVACAPGFYTGKPYVLVAQNCIPILYGDGVDPYTWDPFERFLSFNSKYRASKPGDLLRIVELLKDPQIYYEQLTTWVELCKPHWELLDDCVSELLDGADVTSPSWRERFGGYDRI